MSFYELNKHLLRVYTFLIIITRSCYFNSINRPTICLWILSLKKYQDPMFIVLLCNDVTFSNITKYNCLLFLLMVFTLVTNKLTFPMYLTLHCLWEYRKCVRYFEHNSALTQTQSIRPYSMLQLIHWYLKKCPHCVKPVTLYYSVFKETIRFFN